MRKKKKIPLKPRSFYAIKKAGEFLRESGSCTLPTDPFSFFEKYGWIIMSWSDARNTGHDDPFSLKKDNADAKVKYLAAHEDDEQGQYIVVYDDTLRNAGRIRWTIAHEIAHIVLGHLIDFEETMLSRGGLTSEEYKILEKEADIFAAELLAPVTVLKALNQTNDFHPDFIMNICDLSFQAAKFRSDFLNQLNNYKLDEAMFAHYSEFIADYGLQNYNYEIAATIDELFSEQIEGDESMEPVKRKEIPIDENNRFLYCPRCAFNDFEDDAVHCTQCGEHLFNRCLNVDPDGFNTISSCGKIASGNDRYCRLCGSETYLMSKGYLSSWIDDFNEKTRIERDEEYIQLHGFDGINLVYRK